MTHSGIITPAQIETLRAVPTGHEPNAQGTAQDIAQALDITTAQAAARLGALRKAGLVARDAPGNGAGVATWARFDSLAPGLETWQRKALEGAERAAPCRYQAEALETFGMGKAIPFVDTLEDCPPSTDSRWNENRPAQTPQAEALEALKVSRDATQGHPDSDILGAALAACDALPRAGGLMTRPRPYLCRVCGHVETFSTNHTGPHYSPCAACSWRGGRDDSGRYYNAQDKGRPHVYAGDNPQGTGETNPHARKAETPQAPALPAPGVTLDNGAVALEARAVDGRAFVLALTGHGRACSFAVWRLGPPAMGKAWPCYSGDYFRDLGDALDALATRARAHVTA